MARKTRRINRLYHGQPRPEAPTSAGADAGAAACGSPTTASPAPAKGGSGKRTGKRKSGQAG